MLCFKQKFLITLSLTLTFQRDCPHIVEAGITVIPGKDPQLPVVHRRSVRGARHWTKIQIRKWIIIHNFFLQLKLHLSQFNFWSFCWLDLSFCCRILSDSSPIMLSSLSWSLEFSSMFSDCSWLLARGSCTISSSIASSWTIWFLWMFYEVMYLFWYIHTISDNQTTMLYVEWLNNASAYL